MLERASHEKEPRLLQGHGGQVDHSAGLSLARGWEYEEILRDKTENVGSQSKPL